HIALYVGLVLMPLTGISILVGNGYGLKAFGMQLVAPGPEIEWLATFGGVIHSPLAWLLVLLVAGHIGAALWHGLVRKDGVLQRMHRARHATKQDDRCPASMSRWKSSPRPTPSPPLKTSPWASCASSWARAASATSR